MFTCHHGGWKSLITITILLMSPFMLHAQNNQCGFPNLLLVMDRSASMNNNLEGQQSKWDVATTAINAMLDQFANRIHFGLMLYPGPSGLGANGITDSNYACRTNYQNLDCTDERPRCSTGEVVVDIGGNTEQNIRNQLIWPDSLSHAYTPTWQSLAAVGNYAPLLQSRPSGQYVILLTDGWQCCGYYNSNGMIGCEDGADRFRGVDEIESLRNQGITPFIIGFGGSIDVVALQRMAVAAGTQRAGCDPSATQSNSANLCYYQASDSVSLNMFLSEIARQISNEICDGIDNDCDGQVDEGITQACSTECGNGVQTCDFGQWGECSASNPEVEVCDGIDNDCDGQSDESLTQACMSECGQGVALCTMGQWGDCSAPMAMNEMCNGIDDNCDGRVDEGCTCMDGEQQACGSMVGACRAGEQVCSQNQWGACVGAVDAGDEICDGVDNDCDGQVDEFLTQGCSNQCGNGQQVCQQGMWSMCDVSIPEEVCDGIDNDCDGQVDEALTQGCSNQCGNGVQVCTEGIWGGCQVESNVQELCDGMDNDCDGIIDEGGSLCGERQMCRCGGCMDPCEMNECDNGAICIEGYCDIDQCPTGYFCQVGQCIEGENPFEEEYMSGGDSNDSEENGNGGNQNQAQGGASCRTLKSSGIIEGLILLLLTIQLMMQVTLSKKDS